MILGVLLAAGVWLCDPHRICSYQHDYVGIGDRQWPAAQPVKHHYPGWWGHERGENRRPLSKDTPSTPHKPCRLGDKNWKNDCNL